MSPWCPNTSNILIGMLTNITMQLYCISCVYYITEEKTKIINKENKDQYIELQRLRTVCSLALFLVTYVECNVCL